MSRKGENIYKRKDGRFEARYVKVRDDDNKVIKYGFVYGKTYTEAKMKKNLAIKNIGTNKDTTRETFSTAIDKWLKTKKEIKNTTYYNYLSVVNSGIKPYFKNKKLYNLNENDILKFTEYLYEKNLSNKRIRDILLVLKQFFKYKKINIDIKYPRLKKKGLEIFNEREVKILEENLINSNIKDFCIILTLFTGLRIGELCALKWKDIDVKNKIIHIDKTLARIQNNDVVKTKVVLDLPKTENSIRIVPIHKKLLPYLEEMKKDQDKENFILTGSEEFMTYHSYYNYYKVRLEKLHLKHYTFHVLRHTFASRALKCGVDIKTLSEILGHSSVKITIDRYVHIREEEKIRQINKLSFLS